MNRSIVKIFDWLILAAALIIVLLAVLLSVARLFLPQLTQYQPRIQQWASQAVHQPVVIGRMTAAWWGLEPEIKFQHVEILNADQSKTLLKVNELDVGIDILKSLFEWKIVPGWIVASGAHIDLHQDSNGKITLNGITTPGENAAASAVEIKEFGGWLLAQNRIHLEHIDATWYGKDGRVMPFKHIRLNLINSFSSHVLTGRAMIEQIPELTAIHFVLNVDGNIFSDRNYKADLHLNARNVPLAFWLQAHAPDFQATNGIADVEIWVNWSQQQLQKLQSQFVVHNANLKSKYLVHDLTIKDFAGHFLWQRQDQGWNLAAGNTQLEMNGAIWPQTKFNIQTTFAQNSQPATQTLQADVLDVAHLKNLLLATTLLSSHNRTALTQLNPAGELKDLKVMRTSLPPSVNEPTVQTASNVNASEYDLMTTFSNLSWSHWQKLPGATNLSGAIHVAPSSGALTLNSHQTEWNFGSLFRSVLPIDNLLVNAQWQKNSDGWQIQADKFSAANSLFSIAGDMSFFIPINNSSPIINIVAGFNLVDPAQAIKYMPVGIMPKNVVSWVDQAIVDGKDGSGNMVLSGPIQAFPFNHQEGRFIIDSQLNDLTLHYRDGWPDIQHLNSELIFDDSSITINSTSGNIYAAQLMKTQAVIADLRKPILQVDGNLKGDLKDNLQFVEQSPLKTSVGKRLEGFVMQGPMDLDLHLTIPLKEGATQVKGNLTTANSDLKLPTWWNLHVQNLAGNLQFTENSLAGNLQGELFDQPLNVNITTLTPTPQKTITQLDLGSSQMTLEQIQQRFDLPKFPYMDGTLNFHAMLQFITNNTTSTNRLIIDTNMQGINVNLPVPLAKKANDIIPSELQLGFGGTRQLQVFFNYGKKLSAALNYLKNSQGIFTLAGGELTFGGKQAVAQTLPGLVIDGYLPNFSWDDWKPILAGAMPSGQQKSSSLLRSLDVTFDQFKAFGFALTKAEIQLQPRVGFWDARIQSPNIVGQLTIPSDFPRGTLVGNFQRFYLSATGQASVNTLLPKDVPALNFSCDDFRYGDRNVGAVQLRVTPTGNSLNIDRLSISSAGMNLTANGEWQGTKFSQQTSLQGKFTSGRLGTVLQNLNVTKNLVNGNGSADFSLRWAGPPYQFALKNINGQLNMKFFNGRIINLSRSAETEIGLGRVLNLFSLQTLPRRLRFDFSDLTDSGFSFDVMKGNFSLNQGNAVTSNAYMDGPVAKVAMKGRIGLNREDYDLQLMVTPHLSSDIPAVVATIAGGPIAGAITWLAGKLLSSAVKGVTTYTYNVTGSWDNPVIVKQ